MVRGVVRFYNKEKGFGFCAPEYSNGNGMNSTFFHVSDLVVPKGMQLYDLTILLEPGQQVEYEVGLGRDGRPRALNVELIP